MQTTQTAEATLKSEKESLDYRPEIDGLRALAVGAVIINHINKDILPSGYLGVDIFFVISGYVITSSLSRRRADTFAEFALDFYRRRIKRLVPALVVFVLAMGGLYCLVNEDPQVGLTTGFTSLLGISNIYLLNQSADYFAASTELNPFTHTWSLGVEEQFYILFPLLIWLSGYGRGTLHGARNLFLCVAVLSLASLIGFIHVYNTNPMAAYFLMPPRFWEMAAGCLIFLGSQKHGHRTSWGPVPAQVLIVTAMIGVMFLPLEAAVAATILIVLLSSALIILLRQKQIIQRIFASRGWVYIGLISYSLYLWHWGVLSISRWTVGVSGWTIPIQCALMLSLAAASYHFVEKPWRRRAWLLNDRLIGLEWLIIMALSGASLLSLYRLHSQLLWLGTRILGDPKYPNTGILQTRLYCHLPRKSDSAFKDCLGGTRDKRASIYILGDSHASNHYPSIRAAASSLTSRPEVRVLVDWGLINWLRGIDECGDYHPCIQDSWSKHRAFLQESVRPGDIVIFSWYRNWLMSSKNHWPRQANKKKLAIFEDRLRRIADVVGSAGGRLLIADDIPMVCEPGLNFQHFILRMGQLSRCSVKEAISLEDRKDLSQAYKKLASSLPDRVMYFDPHSFLCHNGVCDLLDPKDKSKRRLLYGDERGHFRADYPDPLIDAWRKELYVLQRS